MSKYNSYIVCFMICLISVFVMTIDFFNQNTYNYPHYNYQIYLDGEKLGLVNSKDELYNLINKEQKSIKEKYNVNRVFPPKGFKMVKVNSYNEKLSSINDIYNKIKEEKQFTIKGYTIVVRADENAEPIYIYVLDKDIFESSVKKIIATFITEERFKQYMDNTQPEIVDTGYIIQKMYFKDKITIKESYISVNERIFTDEIELTNYLLFSDDNNSKEYIVKQGDTVESIAYANQLNTGELLIANSNLRGEDTLLAIGQKLNVALINPILTLIYEELVVSDVEQVYQTDYIDDNTQYVGYKELKTPGEKGINRITSLVQFINGAQNEGGAIEKQEVIKPVQNEVIIRGTKANSVITGRYIDTGAAWGWPTNQPSMITSEYGYRWGALHDGMDISGTGRNSPIYASLDGEVVSAGYGGMVGWAAGYNVVLRHDNGYYTVYAHMVKDSIIVKVGDWVTRGQRLGGMGMTGTATGVHLHFGVFYGEPYHGGYSINPRMLWK